MDSKDIESSDSGRSDETGVVHRNRVRSRVRTCSVKWRLPGDDLDDLNVKLAGESLSVTMLDPAEAGYSSCEMYADSVSAQFYQQQNGDIGESWWEISCKLIEL